MENKKNYYSIIPANVRYDKRLKANEKLMYGEITCLCNEKGYCWASNGYFAELYGVTKQSISNWVSHLEKLGYISVEIEYGGNKEILNRYIKIFEYPIKEKLYTPIKEILYDNNKDINNKLNNKMNNKEKIYKKEKHKYGEYKNVLLTDEELEKLKKRFANWEDKIKQLDEGIESKGYKYKSHYLAIIKWSEKEQPKEIKREYTEFWEE